MQTPNIPTDNLYKFLAISGLVISLFSSYFIFNLQYNQQRDIHLFYKSLAEIKIKTDLSKGKINRFQKGQEQLEEINKSTSKNDSIHVSKLKSTLEKLIMVEDDKEIINSAEQNIIDLNKLYSNIEWFEKELKISSNYKLVFLLLVGLGLIISFFGFKLWYVRLQKHIDKHYKNLN